MGILRFLFASNVLFSHTILGFAGGVITVPSFYILSGFYMALVLNEKYIQKNKAYSLFITNRFLRIFPLYWAVLLLLILLALLKYIFHAEADNAILHILNVSHQSPLVFANYILRNLTLIVTIDYVTQFHDTTGEYLLIQQAPTLQLELLFYLLAPFIVRLSIKKLAFISVGYALIFFVVIHTFLKHTLTYNFVANGIFFLLGIVCYRLYRRLKRRQVQKKNLASVVFVYLIWTVFFLMIVGAKLFSDSFFLQWVYYVSLIPAVPVVFLWKNKLDMFLGELSYPIYLSHFLIIKLLHNILGVIQNQYIFTLVVFVITIVASYCLTRAIEIPIDKLRQKRLLH